MKKKTVIVLPEKKVAVPQHYQTNCDSPYVIKIENLTDDKHYKVPVFNMEHEKNKSIRWSSCIPDISFSEIIAEKQADAINGRIGKIIIITQCNYKKFELKQTGCPFILLTRNADGGKKTEVKFTILDPYQQQSDRVCIVIEDANFHLKCLSDIIFEYLMPETSIEVRLYMQRVILPKK